MYDEKEIKYKKRKKKTTKNKINLKKIPNINFNWNTIIPPIVKKINYKQLSLRLSLLLLVMMSVIFLLSRINKQNTQINEKFDENIMLITNAVIESLEEKDLPINIGNSVFFTLNEIKTDLFHEIKDENNDLCNIEESYINITKTAEMEYTLKIYLKCPKKEKIIEQKLFCTASNCKIMD